MHLRTSSITHSISFHIQICTHDAKLNGPSEQNMVCLDERQFEEAPCNKQRMINNQNERYIAPKLNIKPAYKSVCWINRTRKKRDRRAHEAGERLKMSIYISTLVAALLRAQCTLHFSGSYVLHTIQITKIVSLYMNIFLCFVFGFFFLSRWLFCSFRFTDSCVAMPFCLAGYRNIIIFNISRILSLFSAVQIDRQTSKRPQQQPKWKKKKKKKTAQQ